MKDKWKKKIAVLMVVSTLLSIQGCGTANKNVKNSDKTNKNTVFISSSKTSNYR